jgi:hypothetical protein
MKALAALAGYKCAGSLSRPTGMFRSQPRATASEHGIRKPHSDTKELDRQVLFQSPETMAAIQPFGHGNLSVKLHNQDPNLNTEPHSPFWDSHQTHPFILPH